MNKETNITKGIQRLPVKTRKGKKYRARKTVNGERIELRTNNLNEAKRWMKE